MSHPQPGHNYGEPTVGEQYDLPKKKKIVAKKVKEQTPEEARAAFRNTWQKSYGNRPATIVSDKDKAKEKRLNGT